MQALRFVMLLLAAAFCYLLFFRTQPAAVDPATDQARGEVAAPLVSPNTLPVANPGSTASPVHGQYKQHLDRAHAAAQQMQNERAEADAM